MTKKKVYLETSFFSYLTGKKTSIALIAMRQALTLEWWENEASNCDLFVSEYVLREASRGEPEQAKLRLEAIRGIGEVDGSVDAVSDLARKLIEEHAVPETEVTDAYHIATAAVHGMDVLLTWNCRHMANRFALPKTISVVARAGYACPAIVTPEDYMKEALDDRSV